MVDVARITPKTKTLHASLDAAGITLSVGQIQQAHNGGLGPCPDDPDPISHWRALATIADRPLPRRSGPDQPNRQRLPEHDLVAMELATAGHPCPRLPKAVQRLRATGQSESEVEDSDPETVAEQIMQEAQSAGGKETSGGTVINRFLHGSTQSGSPGPARSPEDEKLEHQGRVQATVTGLFEVEAGLPWGEVLDPEDLAAQLGGAVDSSPAFAGLQLLDELGILSLQAADRLTDEAKVDVLAIAVQAAVALVPLWGALGMPSGTERQRWESVAALTPMTLALGNRLMGVDLPALFNRPDIAARYSQTSSELEWTDHPQLEGGDPAA